jgi:hypothetical protein
MTPLLSPEHAPIASGAQQTDAQAFECDCDDGEDFAEAITKEAFGADFYGPRCALAKLVTCGRAVTDGDRQFSPSKQPAQMPR